MTHEHDAESTKRGLRETDPREIARRHIDQLEAERPPESIGPYKILETLGGGGMGIVYLAEQTTPLHRRVALKIIKRGMDTKQTLARFETEREALALMDHPNVAKVYDAGATEAGRPYFVMEYVAGIAITDYCDRNRLTTNERLGLFMDVCAAVQHAHQKGIIHRDIKPSNVLVAVHDEGAVPKVIDFGVAKATERRLTAQTVFTELGQMIGTPGYMSPEQTAMTALDIDTRSDIYSLGVLLYELLVGALPFDTKQLLDAGFGEIQRIIRDVDPPKPSTRLSSLGADSTVVAHKRHTEPRTLARELRGDLDWIVMKCLEKDRTRRYATANGLALEIRRHLDHQPVLAGPPKVTYRIGKFVRRNRTGVGVAAMLLVAVAAAGYFYWKARQAEFAQAQAMLYAEQAKNRARQAEFAAAQTMLYAEQAKNLQLAGKHAEAWDVSQKALALDPENSLALRTSAYLLLNERGDFQAALKAYDKGLEPLERFGILPEDFHNRARLLRIFGRYESALKDHNRAIALRPDVGIVYLGRGLTRRFAGDFDGAIADFLQAGKLPGDWFLQTSQWIWEMRMLRDAPGDREAAQANLAEAERAATKPFDKAMSGISRGEVSIEDGLTAAGSDEKLRCVAYYYAGARALVEGSRNEAEALFRQCQETRMHMLPEYDLAEWHLKRLGG